MVEERTGGRVKITNYFGQALLKYGDTYRGVSSGIADISLYVIGASEGIHDINEVISLPFLGLPDMVTGAQIYKELRQKFPELDQENSKTGTMWLDVRMMAPTQLHLVNKTVRAPEDLKGMKVIASGAAMTYLLQHVDGAAVHLGPPDWYLSLERGLVEAQLTHWLAVYEFGLLELFNYHTMWGDAGISMVPIGFLINLETWNSLPPDLQDILVEVYTWADEQSNEWDLGLLETALKTAAEQGNVLTYLTPSEIQPWVDLMTPYHEQWIEEMEGKGWPARAMVDEAKKLVAKYSK